MGGYEWEDISIAVYPVGIIYFYIPVVILSWKRLFDLFHQK